VLANGKVGYLKIAGFSSGSSDDFHNLLDQLVNTDKVQAIVLDLRDDPGGYVDAAQKIASEFVADRPLYFEQTAQGDPQPQQPIPGGVGEQPTDSRRRPGQRGHGISIGDRFCRHPGQRPRSAGGFEDVRQGHDPGVPASCPTTAAASG